MRYLGNYEDYLREKAAEEAASAVARPAATLPPVTATVRPKAEKKPAKLHEGTDTDRLTAEIARCEEEQASLSAELARSDFYSTHPDPDALITRYAKLKREVEDLYRRLDQVLAEG